MKFDPDSRGEPRADLELEVLPDAGALARAAAESVLARADQAQAERGVFHVALAGGSTPRATYECLAERPFDTARWQVWFGDERCVPPEHAESNFRMAREALLARAPFAPESVHRMRGEEEPARAAHAYELELRRHFGEVEWPRLDLVLLGLGTDGHTASLFPGSSALDERSAWVAATCVERLGVERLTLTLPVLCAAREVLFLVAGANKVDALRSVLDPRAGLARLPAARVRPRHGHLHFLVDRAAAAGLGSVDA